MYWGLAEVPKSAGHQIANFKRNNQPQEKSGTLRFLLILYLVIKIKPKQQWSAVNISLELKLTPKGRQLLQREIKTQIQLRKFSIHFLPISELSNLVMS